MVDVFKDLYDATVPYKCLAVTYPYLLGGSLTYVFSQKNFRYNWQGDCCSIIWKYWNDCIVLDDIVTIFQENVCVYDTLSFTLHRGDTEQHLQNII